MACSAIYLQTGMTLVGQDATRYTVVSTRRDGDHIDVVAGTVGDITRETFDFDSSDYVEAVDEFGIEIDIEAGYEAAELAAHEAATHYADEARRVAVAIKDGDEW